MMGTVSNDSPSSGLGVNSWLELTKSDYAKVIFCDLYHHSDGVGCRFQITDNVHEDPCDYIGLFRVGYDNLSQCLVSKMLSETKCEEDGKLLRCVFKSDDLPELDDGFYQFLYVTRDKEVCGASMPFEIKQLETKEDSSDEDIVADQTEDDFLVVRSNLIEKNRTLQTLVDTYRINNQVISSDLAKAAEEKMKLFKEKEEVIANLHKEILNLKRMSAVDKSRINRISNSLEVANKKLQDEVMKRYSLTTAKDKLTEENRSLQEFVMDQEAQLREKFTLIEQDKSILLEQLEDGKVMVKALEDSKALALQEVNELSESLSEHKKMVQELKCANIALELKLEDERAENEKLKQAIQELKCMNVSFELKLEDEKAEMQKSMAEKNALVDLTKNLKQVLEEKTHLIGMQKDELDKLENSVKILQKSSEEKEESLNEEPKLSEENHGSSRDSSSENNQKLEVVPKLSEENPTTSKDSSSEKYQKLEVEPKLIEEKPTTSGDSSSARDRKLQVQERMIREMKCVLAALLENKYDKEVNGVLIQDLKCLLAKGIVKDDGMKQIVSALDPHCDKCEHTECTLQMDNLKMQLKSKVKDVEKLSSRVSDLHSLCFQWDDEIHDLKSHCAELRSDGTQKDSTIAKLKEDCIKKDAVIEFLTKEKHQILKSEANLQDALVDATVRLTEAAKIYKKQYIEIEKLKKEIRKYEKSKLLKNKSLSKCSSNAPDYFPLRKMSYTETMQRKDCLELSMLKAADRNMSDSDTGEHVIQHFKPHPVNVVFRRKDGFKFVEGGKFCETGKKCSDTLSGTESVNSLPAVVNESCEKKAEFIEVSSSATHSIHEVSSENGKKSSDLSKMIEENLACLSASASKNDSLKNTNEDVHTVPCDICLKSVTVSSGYDDVIKHLEIEHKQQMCPVCGKLFDMSLPKNYLVYHVDDHFLFDKK